MSRCVMHDTVQPPERPKSGDQMRFAEVRGRSRLCVVPAFAALAAVAPIGVLKEEDSTSAFF